MADHRDEISGETHSLASKVADRLRTPERLPRGFDETLMWQVRAEGPSLYPAHGEGAWWRSARLNLSPVAALAMAAGIAALAVLSTLAIGSRTGAADRVAASTPASAAKSDTVNLVRFVFVDSHASSVEIVGDFNEWTKGANTLKLSGAPGVWSASIPLSPGRHEYAFIINGTRWVADPLAVKSSDDFGTESSVIRVGAANSTT